ncbi:MAG: hypothetical protein ABJG41_10125 [Cyclobacteriaceae bacterium]
MRINKSLLSIALVSIFTLAGCHATYYKVKMVKPKRHFGYFDASKDRKKKRIKTVRYKSLKSTKGIGSNADK